MSEPSVFIAAFNEAVRARRMREIEPGARWIKRRRKGPPVLGEIRWVHTTEEPGCPENKMDRSPFLAAFIDGKPVALDEVWLARALEEPSQALLPFYRADREWLVNHDRANPLARAGDPVDHNRTRLDHFRRKRDGV